MAASGIVGFAKKYYRELMVLTVIRGSSHGAKGTRLIMLIHTFGSHHKLRVHEVHSVILDLSKPINDFCQIKLVSVLILQGVATSDTTSRTRVQLCIQLQRVAESPEARWRTEELRPSKWRRPCQIA